MENPRAKEYSVSFWKEDGYTNRLEGAVFGLYADADCNDGSAITGFDSNGLPETTGGVPITATSGADGIVRFGNLPFGTYYIKEIFMPEIDRTTHIDKYNMSGEILTVEILPSGRYSISGGGSAITLWCRTSCWVRLLSRSDNTRTMAASRFPA
jgi:WD40 repeat protein